MRILVWTLLAFSVVGLSAAEPAKPMPFEDVELANLVKDLGSEVFSEREAAHRKLLAAGDQAVPHLARVVKETDDAELRQRAEGLLRQLTVAPRMRAAVQDLGSDKWEVVENALTEVCGEMAAGQNVDEFLSEGRKGPALRARMIGELLVYQRQAQQIVAGGPQILDSSGRSPENEPEARKLLVARCKAIFNRQEGGAGADPAVIRK